MFCDELAGVESVLLARDSGAGHYFSFVFPWSHGLAASVVYSVLAGGAVWLTAGDVPRRSRLAAAMSVAAFSHFILDWLVHVPDLPLFGEGSVKLGLGLWRHMPVALGVELVFSCAALVLYLRISHLPSARRWLMIGMTALTGVLTAAGPCLPGEPPAPTALAGASLLTLLVIVSLAFAAEGRVSVTAREWE